MELSSLQIRSEYQQSGASQQLRDAASVILSCPLACITFKLQKRALQGKLFHHQHSGSMVFQGLRQSSSAVVMIMACII